MVAYGYTSGDPSKVDTASVGTVGGPAGPLDASGLVPAAQIPGGGGGTPADTVTSETSYGTAAAAGAATTYSRGDHTHGTPAAPTPTGIGAVPSDSTVTADPAAPLIKHQRNYAVDSNSRNIAEYWVNGTLQAWLNEWGALRGTPPYSFDAVVRMVAHASQSGNIIEYQTNDRTQVLWGVDETGATVQGNGSAAAVTMAPVYVAAAADTLPADLPPGLPAGTVVIQLSA